MARLSPALLLLPLLNLCLFGGCSYHRDKNGNPSTAGGGAATLDEARVAQLSKTVDFAQVKEKVLAPLCMKCHNDSNPPRACFDTYEETKNHLGEIDKLVPGSMPKNGTISAEELALLKAWIRAGAPLYAQTQTGTSPPPVITPVPPQTPNVPEEFRWSNVRAVVFEKSCMKCHSGDDAAAELDLGKLDQVRDSADDIISRVLLTADDDDVMPPAKEPRLTSEQLRILMEFFKNGMEE